MFNTCSNLQRRQISGSEKKTSMPSWCNCCPILSSRLAAICWQAYMYIPCSSGWEDHEPRFNYGPDLSRRTSTLQRSMSLMRKVTFISPRYFWQWVPTACLTSSCKHELKAIHFWSWMHSALSMWRVNVEGVLRSLLCSSIGNVQSGSSKSIFVVSSCL